MANERGWRTRFVTAGKLVLAPAFGCREEGGEGCGSFPHTPRYDTLDNLKHSAVTVHSGGDMGRPGIRGAGGARQCRES